MKRASKSNNAGELLRCYEQIRKRFLHIVKQLGKKADDVLHVFLNILHLKNPLPFES